METQLSNADMHHVSLILDEQARKTELDRRVGKLKKKKKQEFGLPKGTSLPVELMKAWREREDALLQLEVEQHKLKEMERLCGATVETVVRGRMAHTVNAVEIQATAMVPLEAIKTGDPFWAYRKLEQFVADFREQIGKELGKIGGSEIALQAWKTKPQALAGKGELWRRYIVDVKKGEKYWDAK